MAPMEIRPIHKKIITLGLLIVSLTVSVKRDSPAQQSVTDKIELQSYTVEVERETLPLLNKRVAGSNVRCGLSKEIVVEISDEFATTIEQTVLRELLTAFGLHLDFGTAQARLKAQIELRNKLVSKAQAISSRGMIVKTTQKLPLKELRCYNQEAFIAYSRDRYKVMPKSKAWMGSNLKEFEWTENTNFDLRQEATYDESCDRRRCQIPNKMEILRGRNNQELLAYIPYKNQTYIVPLYWATGGILVDPVPLLPNEVIEDIRVSGTQPRIYLVGASR